MYADFGRVGASTGFFDLCLFFGLQQENNLKLCWEYYLTHQAAEFLTPHLPASSSSRFRLRRRGM